VEVEPEGVEDEVEGRARCRKHFGEVQFEELSCITYARTRAINGVNTISTQPQVKIELR